MSYGIFDEDILFAFKIVRICSAVRQGTVDFSTIIFEFLDTCAIFRAALSTYLFEIIIKINIIKL